MINGMRNKNEREYWKGKNIDSLRVNNEKSTN